VYAILARGGTPSRLLAAYLVAGLLFTVAFGVLVIAPFTGIELHAGSDHTKGVAEIAGGIIALIVGAGVLSGRVGVTPRRTRAPRKTARVGSRDGEPTGEDERAGRARWWALLDRRITVRGAALAGPATHLPGLFYLLALDLIVASQRGLSDGILDVVLYNVTWFALPIAALAVCVVDPPRARWAVQALQGWTGEHVRELVAAVSFTAGIGLVVSGLLTL
jgi:Sap, sulfolipid-1-addressing protein